MEQINVDQRHYPRPQKKEIHDDFEEDDKALNGSEMKSIEPVTKRKSKPVQAGQYSTDIKPDEERKSALRRFAAARQIYKKTVAPDVKKTEPLIAITNNGIRTYHRRDVVVEI